MEEWFEVYAILYNFPVLVAMTWKQEDAELVLDSDEWHSGFILDYVGKEIKRRERTDDDQGTNAREPSQVPSDS